MTLNFWNIIGNLLIGELIKKTLNGSESLRWDFVTIIEM